MVRPLPSNRIFSEQCLSGKAMEEGVEVNDEFLGMRATRAIFLDLSGQKKSIDKKGLQCR